MMAMIDQDSAHASINADLASAAGAVAGTVSSASVASSVEIDPGSTSGCCNTAHIFAVCLEILCV